MIKWHRILLLRQINVFVLSLGLTGTLHCQEQAAQTRQDLLILDNGDRISGQLDRVDNIGAELYSTSLGLIKVSWRSIETVQATTGRLMMQSNVDQDDWREATQFQSAEFRLDNGVVHALLDGRHVQVPSGSAVLLNKSKIVQETKQEHPSEPPLPPQARVVSGAPAQLQIGVDAPQTVVDGTQSQETFGGNVRLLYKPQPLCGPASWYTAMLLSAAHNRNWKVKSQANVTDTYDGTISLKNAISKGSRTSLFGIADLFGNSSLGVGLQQSYGAGLSRLFYATACDAQTHNYIFSFAGDVSVRYLHQRLYSPGGHPEFAGVNIRDSLSYTPLFKDSQGHPVERVGFDFTLWAMPTINDIRGIQAGGAFTVSAPLSDNLSISLSEEDDFINNAPKAKRKNYLKSGLTLSYTFPPTPH